MLKNIDNYRFEDLFDMSEIQKLIDSMSEALCMGLVIVSPEGEWITKPSSKCHFCEKLVKNSKKGYENCKISDAVVGKPNKEGPIIQKCLSAGLMDAGISIFLKDKHIASWVIGQVRIESEITGEEENIAKAKELGIEPKEYCDALNRVPIMTMERFVAMADMINNIAVQLSELAYKSYLQKEELHEKEVAEKVLEQEKDRFGYIANHDVLTGLGSRAYFEEEFQDIRSKEVNPCTYIACDINNLKYTNDIFGHDKGDVVIKTAARILKAEAKESYIIGRCGGDEINILIPGGDETEANDYIRRVQTACHSVRECNIPISVAMGCKRLHWKDNAYEDDIIQADEEMYKNKRKIKKSQNLIKEIYNRLAEKGYINVYLIDKTVDVIKKFGKYLGLQERVIARIALAARIADIGYIAVPDSAFAGNLKEYNTEERSFLDKHTIVGSELAKLYPNTQRTAKVILQSHEAWDGQGYPYQLKGDSILYEARVLYLINMYVVWATKSDKLAEHNEVDVIEHIKERAGTQFDPELVVRFLEFLEKTQYRI